MFYSYLKYKCSLILGVLVLQGQLLTLIEYLLLLYRALLPAPVWYRFFLNKEYGSLFSSLMTGLYLTFKLTSVVEKVWFFTLVGKCAMPQHRYFPPFSDQNLDIVYYRFIVTMSPTLQSPCVGWCLLTSLGLLSGPILLCCFEGIVSQRDTLWCLCNIRTGSAYTSFMQPTLSIYLKEICM